MRFYTAILAVVAAHIAAAAPFSFPLPNGFPNLDAAGLAIVMKLGGGSLPNGPLPTNVKKDGVQALQLIALNEFFEVAFFSELLTNITTGVHGYTVQETDFVVKTLTSVLNQEQTHALSANAVLANAKKTPIQPCRYNFPVTDFESAILLAQTFTDVVLGVLPAAQSVFAADGGEEAALIPIVGSIIGQEGQQTGYYRFLQRKVPSAAPFLTSVAPQFAFTALNQFIVPGSCPNIDVIGLTALPALKVEPEPPPASCVQQFSIAGTITATTANIVYMSGQNLPVVVPIRDVNTTGGTTNFAADFPFDKVGFSRGLTLAAVVDKTDIKFSSASDVAKAALFGPALIEVN